MVAWSKEEGRVRGPGAPIWVLVVKIITFTEGFPHIGSSLGLAYPYESQARLECVFSRLNGCGSFRSESRGLKGPVQVAWKLGCRRPPRSSREAGLGGLCVFAGSYWSALGGGAGPGLEGLPGGSPSLPRCLSTGWLVFQEYQARSPQRPLRPRSLSGIGPVPSR